MNVRIVSATILLALVWLPAGPSADRARQTRPQFRAASNTVEVYATVVDRTGRLVPDLTQADFEVQDSGKTQAITVFEAGVQPITIAIMLDESPSLFESSERLVSAVSAFSRSFLPGDRGMLGAFSHKVRIEPQLSRNLRQSIANIDEGRPRFPSGTALWDAIDTAARALGSETGRRVILVLTDAEDNCSRQDPDDVRRRVERSGTMVYAVGVKGDGGLPARDLRDLTRDSGGYYFELKPTDELASTFARVADELHRQYLIGFSAPALDGKTHDISVKIKKPGLTARARKAYVAPGSGGPGGGF
jgi:Ca-activated chloride channel homolog